MRTDNGIQFTTPGAGGSVVPEIRCFVDPKAVFLFVAPAEISAAADRFDVTPFDIEDVFWSHRGDAGSANAVKNRILIALAIAALVDTFFFDVPLPIIILAAALIGWALRKVCVSGRVLDSPAEVKT